MGTSSTSAFCCRPRASPIRARASPITGFSRSASRSAVGRSIGSSTPEVGMTGVMMSGIGPGGGTGDPSGAGPDEVLATDGSPGGLTALGPSAPETIDFAGPLEPAPVGAAAVAVTRRGPGAGSLDRQAICGEVGYGAGRFRQPGNETAATLATRGSRAHGPGQRGPTADGGFSPRHSRDIMASPSSVRACITQRSSGPRVFGANGDSAPARAEGTPPGTPGPGPAPAGRGGAVASPRGETVARLGVSSGRVIPPAGTGRARAAGGG